MNEDVGIPWWESSNKDLARNVGNAFSLLKSDALGVGRTTAYRDYLSIYLNRGINSEFSAQFLQSYYENGFSRAPFNLAKLVLDMIQNRVAKMTPRPKFLPKGGNYSLHKKAETLEKWVSAQFRWSKIYEEAQNSFLDCLIYGTGALKVYRQGEKICAERTYPGELFIDELEGVHNCVTQLFQRKFISRRYLAKKWPEFKKEILATPVSSEASDEIVSRTSPDRVEVIESWHLPTTVIRDESEDDEDYEEEKTDGRHVIVVGGVTLVDEEWKHDDFPFLFSRWSRNPRGWFGIGLVEELAGVHIDANYTIERINRSIELTSSREVWVENSAQVKTSKITNIAGSINTYTGKPPISLNSTANNPEVYNYLQSLVARAMQIGRLSENTLNGDIPSGLETGAAVQNWNSIQGESFQLVSQQYEKLFVGCAEWMVRFGKECFDSDPDYSVVASYDKYTIEDVPWKKIDLDKDSYIIEIWPVSSLPSHPSGKLDYVDKMVQMQSISPAQALELLGMPDTEGFQSLNQAAQENINHILEEMVDSGVYTPPEPWMQLELAIPTTAAWINKAQRMGIPENRRSLLIKFARALSVLKQEALAQAMPPAPMAPPGSPPMAPSGSIPQG